MPLCSLSYINSVRAYIGLSNIFSIFALQSVRFAEKSIGNLIKFKIHVYGSHSQIVKNIQCNINTQLLHNPFPNLGFFESGSNLN